MKTVLIGATVTLAAGLAFGSTAWAHHNANHSKGPKVQPVVDFDIQKERLAGPYEVDLATWFGSLSVSTFDLSSAVDQDPEDEGGVIVGWDVPQHFDMKISVTNNTGVTQSNLAIYDVIPADLNLAWYVEDQESGTPAEEEDAADGNLDGNCGDGTCDGTDTINTIVYDGFDFCTDLVCDGIVLTQSNAACDIVPGQPQGAIAGRKGDDPLGQRWKEPEQLAINVNSIDDGGTCMFTIYVVTDGNPGHVDFGADSFEDCLYVDGGEGNPAGAIANCSDNGDANNDDPRQILLFTLYSPTSCGLIKTVDHDSNAGTPEIPVFDTFALNDGIKVFKIGDDEDDLDSGGTAVESWRLVGPEGSLQLTPNGHDGSFTADPAIVGEDLCT
jgi:hypothetical protein